MRPNAEAEKSDRHCCDGHKGVAEDRFAGENRNYFGYDSETGQDQNINLGVAEKPESVFPEQGGAAGRRVEEESVQLPVQEQHHQRGVQRRQGQEHEKGVDRRHPDEQRDLGQFHVRGAQVGDGHEDVDCRHNRPGPGQEKADDPVIHAGADHILVHRIIDRGQRRIGGPSHMEGVSRKKAEIYEESAHQVQPVAEGIHSRERDVASPDH